MNDHQRLALIEGCVMELDARITALVMASPIKPDPIKTPHLDELLGIAGTTRELRDALQQARASKTDTHTP